MEIGSGSPNLFGSKEASMPQEGRFMRLRPAAAMSARSGAWHVLVAAVALFMSAGLVVAPPAYAERAAASATAAQAVRPTLPPPTGHDRLGVVPLHLVDRSRPDPWVPSQPVRELMVSLWYPAERVHGHPRAPWLPPAAWAGFQQDLGVPPGTIRVPLTHGRSGAPVERARRGRPVVLYSPGLGGNRDSGTVLVEELVSRGYVVVTIDHTYDAGQVQFPDGRVEVPALPPLTPEVLTRAVLVRVADVRFVLDQLTALNAGRNPDAEHQRLPRGLRGALDLSRVGMFGFSLGGATAAEAMVEERRIKAGVNLDGTLFGRVISTGLHRPFMLVGAHNHTRDNDPTWAQLWANLRGWRLNLRLAHSEHNSFNDFQALLPQIADQLNLPPEVVLGAIGTIDPRRSVINQRVYLRAFFDLHLRHRDNGLLAHPSARFPEMHFMP
nr:putative lipase [uncultured bacterium]